MAYDPAKSEQTKEEMKQKVIELAKNFKDNPQNMIEYLQFSTRFYNYSSRNTMLIYQQNPGAMFCNSYKSYKDMGYSVKRGEHGMKILVPTIKTYLNIDGSPVPLSKATKEQKEAYKLHRIEAEQRIHFKVGTVFDIAQTNCPKEDYPKYFDLGYTSEQHKQLYELMKTYCEKELNCKVHENQFNSVSLRGFFDPASNSISLSGMFDDSTKLSVLTHETADAILHKELDKTQIKSEAQMEFEADATSVMLQSYFGLQIPESRQRHLADQYKAMCADKSISSADITKSLDHSHRAYKSVADNINNSLKSELTPSIKNVQASQVTQPILPNQIAMPDMGMAMMM